MAGRIGPLLDDAGGLLTAIGDILCACAARAAASHEAVVVEAVASRHVGSVLAGERGEGTVCTQLSEPVRCAEAVERGGGFRRTRNRKCAAAGHAHGEERTGDREKFHLHPVPAALNSIPTWQFYEGSRNSPTNRGFRFEGMEQGIKRAFLVGVGLMAMALFSPMQPWPVQRSAGAPSRQGPPRDAA